MPARSQKPAKTGPATETLPSTANKNGGPKTKARPGALGQAAAHTRINAFVSSRGRQNQAKRDAR